MCGICGKLNFNSSKPVSPDLIDAMTDVMEHRGPDDRGTFIGKGVGLGHRRLSIIDLSPLGHQPMSNEDGSISVVFNGEIYNYLELREELLKLGHSFRSATDTEVIVHAYEEYGREFASRFNGMFAIGI
ncbi:MAG: hypothetical protein HYV23_07000 [Deltaproteobacteria bacterium]|nr:hypothetical protein [Deltaproteobacteria bacterium]